MFILLPQFLAFPQMVTGLPQQISLHWLPQKMLRRIKEERVLSETSVGADRV
jgi:hypothetical protein